MFLPLVSPALASLALLAQTAEPGPALAQAAFLAEAQRQQADERAPGLAVALVEADQVIEIITLGVADRQTGREVAPTSPFRSASTLKMVVAAAILRQAGTDQIPLDTPIGNLAPDLPAFLHPITLHQLLTHTAGLVDRTDDFGRLDGAALRDAILSLEDDTLYLPPGTAFSYSNIGYNIAGYVLEKMANEPFDVALERLVLSPLSMDHSTFETARAQALGWAAPHWQGTPLERNPENRAEWPSGMMYTSAADVGRFLAALMQDGIIDGERVWPAGLSERLVTDHVRAEETATGFGYGYGVMIGTFAGRRAWFHSGGLPGYRANVLALPDDNLAIALLANGEGFDRTALLETLIPSAPPSPTSPSGPMSGDVASMPRLAGLYTQADDLPSLCVYERDGAPRIDSRGRTLSLHRDGETGLVGLDAYGNVRARYRLYFDARGEILALGSWVRAFRRTADSCD